MSTNRDNFREYFLKWRRTICCENTWLGIGLDQLTNEQLVHNLSIILPYVVAEKLNPEIGDMFSFSMRLMQSIIDRRGHE